MSPELKFEKSVFTYFESGLQNSFLARLHLTMQLLNVFEKRYQYWSSERYNHIAMVMVQEAVRLNDIGFDYFGSYVPSHPAHMTILTNGMDELLDQVCQRCVDFSSRHTNAIESGEIRQWKYEYTSEEKLGVDAILRLIMNRVGFRTGCYGKLLEDKHSFSLYMKDYGTYDGAARRIVEQTYLGLTGGPVQILGSVRAPVYRAKATNANVGCKVQDVLGALQYNISQEQDTTAKEFCNDVENRLYKETDFEHQIMRLGAGFDLLKMNLGIY
jgi:hypothetical protein